jgi:hypothetical protein
MSQDRPPTRRDCLRTFGAAGLVPILLPRGQDNAPASRAAEDGRIDAALARAREVGIDGMQVRRTARYIAIGNAPDDFQAAALNLCEGLAADFLKHFESRKFDVHWPPARLTVVVLADPDDLASFLGENPGGAVRGIFDLDADWLAMCDNRGTGDAQAERANTVALMHEATHQLTFHTGLLDLKGDVPLAISEGLACYGETRRPNGRPGVGARNPERLAVLAAVARQRNGRLIPLANLIRNDDLLNQPESEQLAYAQSWLLIHMLLQTEPNAAKLRAYLDAVRPRREASQRLDDAATHLGDLDALDAELRRYANRLLRR